MPATRLFARPEPYTAHVPLRQIKPGPAARRSASRRSVEAFGMLSLPILREIDIHEAERADYYYSIVDGIRRIEDVRETEGEDATVLALVLPADVGEATAHAISIAMNASRAESPAVEAQKLADLRDRGLDMNRIARYTGMTRSKIANRLLLYDQLPAIVFGALLDGQINVGVASRLARLDEHSRNELVAMWERGNIKRITHADISDYQEAARSAAVDQVPLVDVDTGDAAGTRTDARIHIRNAVATGLDPEALHRLLDEVIIQEIDDAS